MTADPPDFQESLSGLVVYLWKPISEVRHYVGWERPCSHSSLYAIVFKYSEWASLVLALSKATFYVSMMSEISTEALRVLFTGSTIPQPSLHQTSHLTTQSDKWLFLWKPPNPDWSITDCGKLLTCAHRSCRSHRELLCGLVVPLLLPLLTIKHFIWRPHMCCTIQRS